MQKSFRIGVLILSLCFIIVCTRFSLAEIAVQHTNAEILGVLSVIDENGIQEAQLAEGKNISQNILEYAKMLDADHHKHLDSTRQLLGGLGLTIRNNASLDTLRAQGAQDLATLNKLDADAFAQLYIADMIKGHSEALNWIDVQNTQNEQVKNFLKETRKNWNLHFEKALQLHEHFQNK